MTVADVRKDPAALTMTITAEFDTPVERTWKLWEDPRQLERWWGPPTFPATFVEHSLVPGAVARYYMTGPEGEQPHGWWRITAVDAPHRLEFEDGFSHDDGTPNPEMPSMTMRVQLAERVGGGTRMTISTQFPSLAAMEQLVTMGMEEGMREAIGQIDAILAGSPAR